MQKETLTVPYIKSEYEYAKAEMNKLGINTYEFMFEQCVNTVIHMARSKSINTEYAPYQLCPKCNGQDNTIMPPWVVGDQLTYTTSTSEAHICNVCNGAKIIPMFKIEK